MLQLLLFVSPESFPSLRPTFYRHFQSSVLALHPAPDGRLHAHPAFIDARNLELLRTLRLSDGFPVQRTSIPFNSRQTLLSSTSSLPLLTSFVSLHYDQRSAEDALRFERLAHHKLRFYRSDSQHRPSRKLSKRHYWCRRRNHGFRRRQLPVY